MLKELDTIILKNDITDTPLKAGMLGTIVFHPENSDYFDVEFVEDSGYTVGNQTFSIPEDQMILKYSFNILTKKSDLITKPD